MVRKIENLSQWESLLYPLMIVLFFIMNTYPVCEGDFFWHLNSGEWIWNHKSLPDVDPFTFTADPQIAAHGSHRIQIILTQYWLGQLILYGLWSVGGFKGIILTRALCYSAILIGIGTWSRQRAKGILPFFFLFLVGAQLLRYPNERPQLFAFLLMPIVLYFLETMRENGDSIKSSYWLLPLLMLTWANIHGSFILGAGIIILFAVGHLVHSWKDTAPIRKGYLFCLLVSVVITLVNPNGFWPLFEFFRTDPYLISITQEYQSPIISLLYIHTFDPYWLLLVATLGLLLFRFRKIPVEHILLLAALSVLSLSGGRYIPFFMFALPIVLGYMPSISLPQRYECLCAVLVLLLFFQFNFKSTFKFRESSDFPRNAVAFTRSIRPEGRIFNSSDWGGYLSRFVPGHQIFLDGRMLVEDVQKKHVAAMAGIGWKELFDTYNISIAILPSSTVDRNTFEYGQPESIVIELLKDKDWVPVYLDPLAIIFVRNIPVHAEIIKKYKLNSDKLLMQIMSGNS
jgi:hypothetical protein